MRNIGQDVRKVAGLERAELDADLLTLIEESPERAVRGQTRGS